MSTKITQKLSIARRGAGGSAAPVGTRLATPVPLTAAGDSGRRSAARPARRAVDGRRDHGHPHDEARHRRCRHDVHALRARASPAEQGRRASSGTPRTSRGSSTRGPTASTTSDARPTRSTSSSRTTKTDAAGRVLAHAQGAEGLRRHPRHLRRRRRRPGRQGRLPDRPHGDDDAEEGPDRDDDHAHVLGPRLVALRGRRRRCSTTTTTSAR